MVPPLQSATDFSGSGSKKRPMTSPLLPLRFAVWCGGLALAGLAASGCAPAGSSCGDKTCSDGATLDFVTPSGGWKPGTYELTLLVDGDSSSCALKVPAMPSPTATVAGACTATMTFDLAPQAQCLADAGDADASTADCAATAGALQQVLTLPGMPLTVVLTLTRDGNMLVQQTIALTYADVHPNGPSCGPTCREAGAVVDVPGG
jgi:hypothetical protein